MTLARQVAGRLDARHSRPMLAQAPPRQFPQTTRDTTAPPEGPLLAQERPRLANWQATASSIGDPIDVLPNHRERPAPAKFDHRSITDGGHTLVEIPRAIRRQSNQVLVGTSTVVVQIESLRSQSPKRCLRPYTVRALPSITVGGMNAVPPVFLVGAHEIADRLGPSHVQSVHTLRKRHLGFPKPVATLKTALIWDWRDVASWAISTGRNSL